MLDSFEQQRAQYLARMQAALRQLELPDLQALAQTIETYHRLATEHLASSWPNLPGAVMHPVRTMLADFPSDLPVDPVLLSITRQRPQPNEHWEQLPCEPASAQARLEAMQPYLKPGQRCLLLGDDDLHSLYLQNEGLELTVLDIDAQLLHFLRQHGFPGQLLEQDLRQVLPAGHYDLVVTDPPWAHQGMQTFLNAALAVLKPGGQLWLSTQPQMLENLPLFEAKLSQLHLEKTWPHLNRYPYPESMLEEVLFQLARYDFDPEPTAAIFHTPYLFADFFLYRRPRGDL
jgi:hypothetical protein